MASVITMAAEKKKLKLSKRKQALAPNRSESLAHGGQHRTGGRAGRGHAVNGERHHHGGGEEEAEAIEKEAGVGAEPLDQQARNGRTDDLRSLHCLRHQPIDGQQSGGRRQRADGHRLRGHEEAGPVLSPRKMKYMALRSRTNTSTRTRTPRTKSLTIMVHFTFHLSTKTPASGLTDRKSTRLNSSHLGISY